MSNEMDARPRLNRDWHEAHPMPRNPTIDQRIAWHLEHERECACRPIPPRLRAEIDKRAGRP
jgi:hypothetical protein